MCCKELKNLLQANKYFISKLMPKKFQIIRTQKSQDLLGKPSNTTALLTMIHYCCIIHSVIELRTQPYARAHSGLGRHTGKSL